jgi:hypothetical protein
VNDIVTGPSLRLEHRAKQIVESLGGSWRRLKGMCRCPAHDDRTPSLGVSLGRRAILFHCFAGCTNEAVLDALGRCGVSTRDLFDGGGQPVVSPSRQNSADRNALQLWRGAACLPGSPAEVYLASRHILLRSSDLRFYARTPLGPRDQVKFLPAMLAAIRNDLGVIAVHRTFLQSKLGRLATFDRPKRALGSLGTGAVRLGAPRGGKLGLAEGVESALSAWQLFGIPCWATLGNERFGLVTIPENVRELYLFVDADDGGRLAEERGRKAYASERRTIVTQCPQSNGQDWNDVLVAAATRIAAS